MSSAADSVSKTANQSITTFRALDFAATLLFIAAIFLIFTNGIPLAQLGLVEADFSKKLCNRILRVAVFGSFAIFGVWAWRWPAQFADLTVVRMLKKICKAPQIALLFAFFITYVFSLTSVGFVRHWAMETRAFDLGIFAQAVWNTVKGDWLYSSIKGGISLLGDHVSPILILIAPLYALWPDPKLLILLQVIADAACIFPIAAIAQQKTRDSLFALMFVLAYWFYLPTRSALHEDFHPEVLAEPFLLMAFIFLERGRLIAWSLCLLIAASAKENMLGITFMFGFYAFVWKKIRLPGLVLMAASVILFFFNVLWVVPHFSGGLYLYRGSYDYLLPNPLLALATRLFHPESMEYAVKIYAPFLFLPLFHLPTLTLTFPVLFQNLISENEVMRSFGYHYTTGLTPFVFISAIYGFAQVRDRWPALQTRYRIHFCVLFLLVILLRSTPAEYFYFADSWSHRSPHRDLMREKLGAIPSEASVLTHNNFIPHAVNRKRIYQFLHSSTPSRAEQARQVGADYVIFDRAFWEPKTSSLEQNLSELQAAGYQTEFQQGDFYVLRRQA